MTLLLGSILTVLLSGVVAALVSFLLNAKKEQFLFKQRKAEELFLATEAWGTAAFSSFAAHYPFMKGEMSQDRLNDLLTKQLNKDVSQHFSNMTMLTRFYFPELEPALEAYLNARTPINEEIFAQKRGRGNFAIFDRAIHQFGKAGDAFKAGIIEEGRKYAELEVFGGVLGRIRHSVIHIRWPDFTTPKKPN